MKTPKITAESWRSEIERVMHKAGDEGLTAKEIAALLGIPVYSAGTRLSTLFEQGRIKSGRRPKIGKDGVSRSVPVYVILKEKKRG